MMIDYARGFSLPHVNVSRLQPPNMLNMFFVFGDSQLYGHKFVS